MSSRFPLVLLLNLTLVACSSTSGTGTPSDGTALLANATVVDDGMNSQDHCWEFDGAICTMFQPLKVRYATSHGDAIYVIANDVWDNVVLFQSPDRGVTWRRVAPKYNAYSWKQQAQLFFFQDRISAVMWEDRSESGNATTCRHYILDPKTLELTPGPNDSGVPVPCPSVYDNVTIAGVLSKTEYTLASFRHKTYDFTTGVATEDGFLPCTGEGCTVDAVGWIVPVVEDGSQAAVFTRYLSQDGKPEGCVVNVKTNTGFIGHICSTVPLVAQPESHVYPLLPAGGGLWLPLEYKGHGWLAQLNSYAPDKLESFDLGEGGADLGWKNVVRIRGKDTSKSRFWTVHNGAPHEIVLPPSPCTDDSKCHDIVNGLAGVGGTNSELQYVLDMGDGTYVMFHQLQIVDADMRTRFRLVATRARDANLPSAPSAAGTTELQCARESACFAAPHPIGLNDCVNRWMTMHGGSTTQDKSYQAFLGAKDCAAMSRADPLLAGSFGACTEPKCDGDVPLQCDFGKLISGMTCADVGTTCALTPGVGAGSFCTLPTGCSGPDDSSARCDGDKAINCPYSLDDCGARGLKCVMSEGHASCLATDKTCTQKFCDGDVAYDCFTAGPNPRQDCGRLGLTCRLGDCALTGEELTCDEIHFAPTCSGNVLTFCEAPTPDLRRQRSLDCAAVGLRCVTDSVVGAACALP